MLILQTENDSEKLFVPMVFAFIYSWPQKTKFVKIVAVTDRCCLVAAVNKATFWIQEASLSHKLLHVF